MFQYEILHNILYGKEKLLKFGKVLRDGLYVNYTMKQLCIFTAYFFKKYGIN